MTIRCLLLASLLLPSLVLPASSAVKIKDDDIAVGTINSDKFNFTPIISSAALQGADVQFYVSSGTVGTGGLTVLGPLVNTSPSGIQISSTSLTPSSVTLLGVLSVANDRVGIGNRTSTSKLHVSSGSLTVDGAGAGITTTGTMAAAYYTGAGASLTGNLDMNSAGIVRVSTLSFRNSDVLVGLEAGLLAAANKENTFVGNGAGRVTTLDANVFIGAGAGSVSAGASGDTYVGYRAGLNAAAGIYNTHLGIYAGTNNEGSRNVFLGGYAGPANTSARVSSSTIVGFNAGHVLTTGDGNILVGYNTGDSLTTGARNILIGNEVEAPAVGTNDYLRIGNLITGEMNNSSTTVHGTLYANSFVGPLTGNASTVTNGVYTVGDQTIGGTKTFSNTIAGSINGNAATVTNGVYTGTNFGGDVSGTYNAIDVTDNGHIHSAVSLQNVVSTGTSLAGDVSGVYNATVVADDSHGHTSTTVTGFSGSLAGDVTGTQGATVVGDNSHIHSAVSLQNVVSTGTSFGGDVSGTYSALDVTDNGHIHSAVSLQNVVSTGTSFGGDVSGTYDNLQVDGTKIPNFFASTQTFSGDVTGTYNATAIADTVVTGKLLTNYVSGSGTVAATDSILQGIQKLDGNDGLRVLKAGDTMTGDLTMVNKSVLGLARLDFSGTNVLVGDNTGLSATANKENTFIGYNTGQATTLDANIFIGAGAGTFATTSSGNTYIGYRSGRDSASGIFNTQLGIYAGLDNEGSRNVFLGGWAGPATAAARISSSTLVGFNAGHALTTGDGNILVGYNTGDSLTTGARNILIGNEVEAPAVGTNDYLRIGNLITGEMNNSSTTVHGTLYANSFVGPLTGNISGTSSGFTGNLAGDVTGTQGATVVGDDSHLHSAVSLQNVVSTGTSFGGDVTGTYSATAIANTVVTGKLLTGYTSGSGTVAATDTILQGIQKLDGNDGLRVLKAGDTMTGPLSLGTQSLSAGSITGSSLTVTGKGQFGDYLGIGIAPAVPFQIADTDCDGGNDCVRFGYDGTNYYHSLATTFSANAADNILGFNVNNSAGTRRRVMTILGNGTVGINTATPFYGVDTSSDVRVQNDGSFILGGTTAGGNWRMEDEAGDFNLAEIGVANGRIYVKAGGNVGIGTTAPQSKLTVAGTSADILPTGATQTSIYRIDGDQTNVLDVGVMFSAPYSAWLQSQSRTSNAAQYPLSLNPNGGNVGIGTTAPATPLHIAQDNTSGIQLTISGTTSPKKRLYAGYDSDDDVAKINAYEEEAGSKNLALQTLGGNVGIGTVAPALKAHISGANGLPVNTGTAQTGIMRIQSNGVGDDAVLDFGVQSQATPYPGWLQMSNATDLSAHYPIALNPLGGNVGIGTTAPGAKLVVRQTDGPAALSQIWENDGLTNNEYLALYTMADDFLLTSGNNGAGNSKNIHLGTGDIDDVANAAKLTILADGNVGIGTVGPQNKLVVSDGQYGLEISPAAPPVVFGYDRVGAAEIPLTFGLTSPLYRAINGNVGIGDTAPEALLTVGDSAAVVDVANTLRVNGRYGSAGDNAAFSSLVLSNSVDLGASAFKINALKSGNTNGVSAQFQVNATAAPGTPLTAMTMQYDGKVGIGTTAPIWNLEVADAAGSRIAATDNGGANKKVLALDSPTTANPYAQIFAYDYGAGVGLPLTVPYGRVGIGISAPAYALDVTGGGHFTSSVTAAGGFFGTVTGASSLNVLKAGDTMTGDLTMVNKSVLGLARLDFSGTNVIVGDNAGLSATANKENTFIGYNTGQATTLDANIFIGAGAGAYATTSSGNTYIGYRSGRDADAGFYNTHLGIYSAMDNEGSRNVFLGGWAGPATAAARISSSTIVGFNAGHALTTGDGNILVGYNTGDSLTTGARNILIGNEVEAPTVGTSDHLNIGNLITGTIGSSSVTVQGTLSAGSFNSVGNAGIGIAAPTSRLEVRGTTGIRMSDASVGHGMTSILPTDIFNSKFLLSAAGGIQEYTLSEGGSAYNHTAILGSEDPTDTEPAFIFQGGKKSGTSWQALGAAETVLQVKNYTTPLMTMLGDGNVGIGTSVPGSKLHVYSGSQGPVMYSDVVAGAMAYNTFLVGGVDKGYIQWNANDNASAAGTAMVMNNVQGKLHLWDNSATGVTVSGGNVGVGQVTPTAKLDVKGSGTGEVLIGEWGGGSQYAGIGLANSLATADYNFISSPGDTNLFINRPTGKDINFREGNGTEQVVIAAGGNVGIGAATPTAKLVVNGNIVSSGTIQATSFYGSGANLTDLPAGGVTRSTFTFEIASGGDVFISSGSFIPSVNMKHVVDHSTITITGVKCYVQGTSSVSPTLFNIARSTDTGATAGWSYLFTSTNISVGVNQKYSDWYVPDQNATYDTLPYTLSMHTVNVPASGTLPNEYGCIIRYWRDLD